MGPKEKKKKGQEYGENRTQENHIKKRDFQRSFDGQQRGRAADGQAQLKVKKPADTPCTKSR